MQLCIRDLSPEARPSNLTTNIEINYVQALDFLPKSGALAYVTRQRTIAIVNPSTGQLIREFPNLEPGQTARWYIGNMRVSPDESKLAMVTHSGLGVAIRDVATGKLLYTLPEESGSIWWLAWSPDSQHLAVTRPNGEIGIWNLKEVETQLSQFQL
jgi:WD40 repeat protein